MGGAGELKWFIKIGFVRGLVVQKRKLSTWILKKFEMRIGQIFGNSIIDLYYKYKKRKLFGL